MKTAQQIQFQAALASAYADLFANDADYSFGPNGPSPEALAEKMTDSAIAGKANVTGKGFRRACKAVGIPHTAKAIDAFLFFVAPTKPAKSVTHRSYMLAASGIEALMSGACAAFASGDSVTLKYSDGSSETAECAETAAKIRNYAKDSRCEAPNFFAIVSSVQSKRTVNA